MMAQGPGPLLSCGSAIPWGIRTLCEQLADRARDSGEGVTVSETPAWKSPASLPLRSLWSTSLRLYLLGAGNGGRWEVETQQDVLPGGWSRRHPEGGVQRGAGKVVGARKPMPRDPRLLAVPLCPPRQATACGSLQAGSASAGKSREQLGPRGRESACPVWVGGAGPPSATSRDPSWPTFSQAPLKPPLF